MGKIQELRDKALALRGRKQLVDYEGLTFEVHEPTLKITEQIATLDEKSIALELIKHCTYAPGSEKLLFEGVDGEMSDLPIGLVKALAEAATSFLSEANVEVIQGNS
tara:strand:+ start:184 stop:504 length:321 start_codon:yes stop_codon:yes gene_type:complete